MWNGNFGLWWREQDTQYPNTSQRRRWSFTGVGWKDKRYDNLERKKKKQIISLIIKFEHAYCIKNKMVSKKNLSSKQGHHHVFYSSKQAFFRLESIPASLGFWYFLLGGCLLIGVFSCLLLVFFWLVSQLCYKALAPDLRLLERARRCNDFWSAAGCFGLFTSESVWNPSL